MPFLTGGRYYCPFFWCYMIFRATSIMLHNNIVIIIKQVEFCILFHILCYFLAITFLWIKSFFELPAHEWIHVGPPLFFLYVWFLGVAWKSCIFVASFKNVICPNKFSFRPMLCKSLFSAAVFCSITLWSVIVEYHLLLFIIVIYYLLLFFVASHCGVRLLNIIYCYLSLLNGAWYFHFEQFSFDRCFFLHLTTIIYYRTYLRNQRRFQNFCLSHSLN